MPALQFIHTQVYRYCFGKPADGLEKSVEGNDECELQIAFNQAQSHDIAVLSPFNMIDMLTLNNPPLTQHISVPKDLSQLSCEAFSAGIVEGVLDGLEMVRIR